MSDPVYKQLLEEQYQRAELNIKNKRRENVDVKVMSYINSILAKGEQFKGVINVSLTSITEKIIHPLQDIRKHQVKMVGGYSGRSLDTKIIAPFLRSKNLMSMVESGWLTRSLEQDHPYDLEYPGAIKDANIKKSFLLLIDTVQHGNVSDNKSILTYFLEGLIIIREELKVDIKKLEVKDDITIHQIMNLLVKHFSSSNLPGTARLPVLAFYSIYEILIDELGRYRNKMLQPLGSHTSADLRSGDIGDIQINNDNGTPFEGVEVKYGKEVTLDIVERAIEKINPTSTERYYILSTDGIKFEDKQKIEKVINEIRESHGCQIIINGLLPTLKYYLRLISDDSIFLNNYIDLVKKDPVIKKEHKEALQSLMYNL